MPKLIDFWFHSNDEDVLKLQIRGSIRALGKGNDTFAPGKGFRV